MSTLLETQPDVSRGVRADLSAKVFYIALGGMIVLCFAPALFGFKTFIYRDFGIFGYPLAYHVRESFWQGELPLWNPYSNCGLPFLAQWNTLVLYPLSLIYVLLPLPWSLNFFCLLHLFIAGAGMYRLARQWSGSELGAAIAGAAFAFNGLTLDALIGHQRTGVPQALRCLATGGTWYATLRPPAGRALRAPTDQPRQRTVAPQSKPQAPSGPLDLDHEEVGLRRTAVRAGPVVGDVVPAGARRDPVVRPPECLVVFESALHTLKQSVPAHRIVPRLIGGSRGAPVYSAGTVSKSGFSRTPQSGQHQSSGTFAQLVPGGKPSCGSPSASV